MLNKVAQFIARHQLLQAERLQLVAVSGGADSVAMLCMLRELGYQVEAMHCNFHLRGQESDRDEQFVVDLCKRLGIALHRAHFDTHAYSVLHGVSHEMAARDLRYRYFEQLRGDLQADAICVAHHRDDNVETLLLNLLRGTGLHGLTGMRPRNGCIVRPLLCLCRQDIENYLTGIGQPYVTDSTNLEADVVRNKIRLEVLPLLKRINPAVVGNLQATIGHLTEAEHVYDAAISGSLNRLVHDNTLLISELMHEPSPESILFEWLHPLGFPSPAITQLHQSLGTSPTGRVWQSATHQVAIDRGRLIAEPLQAALPTLRIPETGTYHYSESLSFRFSTSAHLAIRRDRAVACLDAAKARFPLTIRPVREGDRFVPFGMPKGSRLVSDFLTDQKLSILAKRRQLVITDADDRIVWVVGLRPDDRYRVTESTSLLLVIETVSR